MSTYSFLDNNCTLVGPGGTVNLSAGAGSAEEGVTIVPATDINTMTIGAGGAIMHSLHANKSGQVTVALLKTSPTNQQLAQLYAFQTSSAINHGKNTITMANNQTGDVITCQSVAFRRAPDLKYAMDSGMNTWEFDVGTIDRTLGGNA